MKNRTLLINLLQLPFMSFSKCLLLGKAWQVRAPEGPAIRKERKHGERKSRLLERTCCLAQLQTCSICFEIIKKVCHRLRDILCWLPLAMGGSLNPTTSLLVRLSNLRGSDEAHNYFSFVPFYFCPPKLCYCVSILGLLSNCIHLMRPLSIKQP